jgi:hypothetical protein
MRNRPSLRKWIIELKQKNKQQASIIDKLITALIAACAVIGFMIFLLIK